MPRYFFHVHDDRASFDQEGMELPDPQAARVAAVNLAGRIIADEAAQVARGSNWQMEVATEQGFTLFWLDFNFTAAPGAREGAQARLKQQEPCRDGGRAS